MAICQKCKEDVPKLHIVRVEGRRLRYCEDCRDIHEEEQTIAAEAEGAMQGMMEYKGR